MKTEMDEIYHIIGKKLAGEATHDEEKIVGEWLDQSEENRDLYKNLTQGWEGAVLTTASGDRSRVLNRVKERIKQEGGGDENKTRRLLGTGWYRAAASIVVLVSLGALTWFQVSDPFSWLNTFGYQVKQCSFGERINFQLTDGSSVWLNGDSKFKFPKQFESDRREVYLKGEGFFEVHRNVNKPFVVKLKESQVRVLGTSFNIKAYPEDAIVATSVVTGKVAFEGSVVKGSRKKLILLPGQKGLFSDKDREMESQSTHIDKETAWMHGELRFENTPLVDLTQSLYRMYGKRMIIKDNQLKQLKITASFENEDLEEVLKILSMTNEFDYIIGKNKVVLVEK